MRLCKIRLPGGESAIGNLQGDAVQIVPVSEMTVCSLSALLHDTDPVSRARALFATAPSRALGDVELLAPIDQQEVWGAGVTYERSQAARREESRDAGSFYDKVYVADRPELFFKATPSRVVGPRQTIRVRHDTTWCVPEPEIALVVSPAGNIVGFTIGDDVSCRDIEGENPLYLPQAKMYVGCCAIGPAICLAPFMPARTDIQIRMTIVRDDAVVFHGATSVARMARTFEDLVSWLFREQEFPAGVILLTGTGIVPPNEFTLQTGDRVEIQVDGIGTLVTDTRQASPAGVKESAS